MGQHLMRRAPQYVHGFIDRHGRPRFYFRRAGYKRVPLLGLPWSPEFMEAYQAALDETPRVQIGAKRTKPGTVASAVISAPRHSRALLKPRAGRAAKFLNGSGRAWRQGDCHIGPRACRADSERQGRNTRDRIKFPGCTTGAYATRARGRLTRQRPYCRCAQPEIPIQRLLCLDRGGYCGL